VENLDNLLMGDYDVTLDEAGRIAIPRNLRNTLEKGKVVLTKGADPCLWLYTAEEWVERTKDIKNNADSDTPQGRQMRRHNIGNAHLVDIDKQGRVLIPPTLRKFAGLVKDCVVMGQIDYLEIWEKERYAPYECTKEEYNEVSEAFAREKGQKNAGNSSHSGITGRDNSVSRSEGRA
jgi:MraZ protein